MLHETMGDGCQNTLTKSKTRTPPARSDSWMAKNPASLASPVDSTRR